jgi:hypothetical protein
MMNPHAADLLFRAGGEDLGSAAVRVQNPTNG